MFSAFLIDLPIDLGPALNNPLTLLKIVDIVALLDHTIRKVVTA